MMLSSPSPAFWRKWGFRAGLALIFYALAGYVLAPLLLKPQIIAALQRTLDRPVTLDALRIDPFALSADVRGFRLTERDGAALLSVDRLYVRLDATGLFRGAWSIGALRIAGPKIEIIRDSPTDSNIERLTHAVSGPAGSTEQAPSSGLPRLIVRSLQIQNATVTLTDHVPTPPFRTEIGPINVDITRLSTLPDAEGEQHISLRAEGGATLEWTAKIGLDPIVSAGHVSAKGPYAPLLGRYFANTLNFSVPTGSVSSDLDYQLRRDSKGSLAVRIDRLNFHVNDLALRRGDADPPFLTLPELSLSNAHLAWPEKTVGADALELQGLSILMNRGQDGQIDLAGLLGPTTANDPRNTPSPSPEPVDWTAKLGKLAIKDAKAQFGDHALHEPSSTEISHFDVSISGLSNQAGAAFPFMLATELGSGGALKIEGQLSARPTASLSAKATLAGLKIPAAQPYLHEFALLTIEDGRLDAEADITWREQDGLTAIGRGALQTLKLRDEGTKTPILAWDRLSIDRYEYRQKKGDLQLGQVTLGAPYLRLLIAKDRSANFSHLLVQGQKSAPEAHPMKVSVGEILVAGGAVDYGDQSLPLPFAAHITGLHGAVRAVTSTNLAPASLMLRGQVGEFGEVKIDGSLIPFDPTRSTKIAVNFRNVEFPGLSPYTIKFAGRRVADGRLDIDLAYDIEGKKLIGANRVVIRDVELGDKIDVPGAMDLPLDLAIALLKDEDGRITLDLPVEGDLNDPQFDLGAVFWKAVSEILGNMITAPFRMLAGLVGGEDTKLDSIDFEAGRAALDPPEREKLVHLTEALNKRPGLVLAVSGVVDPRVDGARLQLDALDAEMAETLGDHITVANQRAFLETRFAEKIGKDQLVSLQRTFSESGKGPNEVAYLAGLRLKVATAEPISAASLEALAQSRAANILHFPGMTAERTTLRATTRVTAGEDGSIPLKLDAFSAKAPQ